MYLILLIIINLMYNSNKHIINDTFRFFGREIS